MKKIIKLLPLLALIAGAVALIASPAAIAADVIDCSNPVNRESPLCTGDDRTVFGAGGIFIGIVNTLLFIVGALAVIMLIIGGIRYVVSAGDSNAVSGAKNTILYAIIGVVVAFAAYAIVNFVIVRIL